MTLYILKYNNYYNRLVKFENTIENYEPYITYTLESTNFVPNDSVNTQHTFGTGDYDGTGDYLLVVNEFNEIVSRWFIIDSVRTRAGQYVLDLRRDLIADYYNIIIQSPMFVEKASLPYDSPLLFNNEDMTFNQIKQTLSDDGLLKDQSQCAWLVGYYDRNQIAEMNGTVATNEQNSVPAIDLDVNIENWEYYNNSNLSANYTPFIGLPTNVQYEILASYAFETGLPVVKTIINIGGNISQKPYSTWDGRNRPVLKIHNYANQYNEDLYKSLRDYGGVDKFNVDLDAYTDFITQEKFEEFFNFNGKTVRDSNGRYYEINIQPLPNVGRTYNVIGGTLFNSLSDFVLNKAVYYKITGGHITDIPTTSHIFSGSINDQTFSINATLTAFRMTIVRRENLETKYSFKNDSLRTIDAPWNIFAIPYGEITVYDLVAQRWIQTNKEIAINTVMGMQEQHPGIIYDIQLLPYCPIPDLFMIGENAALYIDDSPQYSYITAGEGEEARNVGVIFNVPSSNFSTNVIYRVAKSTTAIEQKINNECDKWRLCSPNYSNYFDFSVEKNGGVQYFNVDCNYKPFTPYIHINPNFGGLYGYDDNSPRGLILGGDFSLSQIIDQWQQYQVQNKNFQEIFDRQIQNMEVNNKYQRINDIVSASVGAVSGAASGAFTGATMSGGNPVGAIVGGVIGGGASIAGGIADYRIKEKLRNEAIDYTKDQFGYQLGNIQALPNTIGKVSAFNENNKIFPVLEYYTCTEEEKTALLNKIAWNGMTTMVIGTINDYLGNGWSYNDIESRGYIKGQLIRFGQDGEDFHIINEIASELNKGVYIE